MANFGFGVGDFVTIGALAYQVRSERRKGGEDNFEALLAATPFGPKQWIFNAPVLLHCMSGCHCHRR
jgi:hypothetical protein